MKINDNIEIIMDDNMVVMPTYPDNYFDLLDADPPYFSGPEKRKYYGSDISQTLVKRREYPITESWELPTLEWFNEVKRISINQIIWGANYFDFIGEPFKTPRGQEELEGFIKDHPTGWIIWDKCNGEVSFNDFELAWTSFDRPTIVFKYMWNGMMQGKSINEGHIMQGNKKLNQKRIHPTEKPILLYDWTFLHYTKPGDRVFSPYMGSGSDALSSINFPIHYTGCENTEIHVNNALKRIMNKLSQPKINFNYE